MSTKIPSPISKATKFSFEDSDDGLIWYNIIQFFIIKYSFSLLPLRNGLMEPLILTTIILAH